MAPEPLTPVVVGVADIKNPSSDPADAIEPMQLMLSAILLALNDTRLPPSTTLELQRRIDSIDVVSCWTWPYLDLPDLLAEKLGAKPRYRNCSPHGGNQPARVFDEVARRISRGESRIAVLTGGEALGSLRACVAAKEMPPPGWSKPTQDVTSVFSVTTRELGDNLGSRHSIGAPIHIYPLYENGFRAHRGQSLGENNRESAQLYAGFAQVAAKNPIAWNYEKQAASEELIGTVAKKNRMICFPYTLLMNAFNSVNLAAACLLTSTKCAEELGIPKSKWIYPLGGAGTQDSDEFWKRPNYYSSPAISKSLDAGLASSGLSKDEVDLFDLYACFPIVPKLACQHLGLPVLRAPKPITLLGGLSSFGGPGNNYSMHAITEMVRQLRAGRGKSGLVLANGGVLTYQHVICLSTRPRRDGSPYPKSNPLPEIQTDAVTPEVLDEAEGEAVIETYTVEFNRSGTPLRAYVVGRLRRNDCRFVANHGDDSTLTQLASGTQEQIGRIGWVQKDKEKEGRNIFSFERSARL